MHQEENSSRDHSGNVQTETVSPVTADQQQVEDPFQSLKVAPQEVLERAQQSGRSKCHKCNGSRMFYCYTCCVLLKSVPSEEIPRVKLPVKIDIIKHPNETDGKSTAVHAKLLAPSDISIYTYPCIPEYEDNKHEVVLVFPGPNSISVEDIPTHLHKLCMKTSVPSSEDTDSMEEPSPKRLKGKLKECSSLVENKLAKNTSAGEQKKKSPLLKRVVFIDSTWNQTNKIITDERLQALVQVELKTRKTCFWRHQKGKPNTYLSTIEAIYYFLIDYQKYVLKEEDYKGEYDNLLFFFSFMYRLIKAKQDTSKQ